MSRPNQKVVMFAQLLASRPPRQRATGGLVGSVVLHGAMIGGALYATMRPHVLRARADAVSKLVYVEPQRTPTPPPMAPAAPVVPPTGLPPVGPIIIDHLPPPTINLLPSPTDNSLFPVVRGPLGVPAVPTSATPAAAPLTAEQVEVPAALAPRSPLPRFPQLLRSSGIGGSARFRFVVDTAGRVEMSTVEQVSASHEAFAIAVRNALPAMRFLPAQVGGRPVRQLVELPFVFNVTR